MKDGLIKNTLYKFRIIPLYSQFMQWKYDKRIKRWSKTDRWYFRFLPISKNKIVFDNFFGKGYGDNSKAIAEEIIRRGLEWDLVWLVNETQEMPSKIRQVKYGSPEAMKELTSARIWVFNCRSVKHPKKKKGQTYLQTWHGTGITLKAIEGMASGLPQSYINAAKKDGQDADFILSYCSALTFIQKNFFWLSKNVRILEYGSPSSDVLFNEKELETIQKRVKDYYNIENKKSIILYMPTFRDNKKTIGLDMDYSRIIDAFENKFKSKCIFLIRLHPNVASLIDLSFDDSRIIDVTNYPEASELFAISDFCITDYSSGIFYGLPKVKKCFIYASDYNYYKANRGFTAYYDNLPIRINESNDDLVETISSFDETSYFEKWNRYLENEIFFNDGKASKRVVDLLSSIISEEK